MSDSTALLEPQLPRLGARSPAVAFITSLLVLKTEPKDRHANILHRGHILNHTLKCSSEQTLPLSYMCSQDIAYEVF